MAGKKIDSLIGYDPLAWMSEKADEKQITPKMPDTQRLAETKSVSLTDAPEDWGLEDRKSAADEKSSNSSAVVSTFVLEPVLNIRDVGALHDRFLAALDNSERIEIDASAVTVADTATLQLLLILKRTAINSQKQVVIDFPSERFIEASNLLGISEMLEVNQAFAGLF